MRYILKKDAAAARAVSGAFNAAAVPDAVPQQVMTNRGMAVGTSHLVALPTGAFQKYDIKIVVYGKGQGAPPPTEGDPK